ncbi:MAG: adenylate/guanylate cyclase domain-containing protein [Myxococcota bacterium]
MRTETLAIVFTDIKGYTAATSKQSHQENAALLRKVERLVAPVVRSFSGRVIKSIGDAYMIVFRSPTEAVRCSAAIQDRLHQYNTNTPTDQGIHIRIAINVGEVRVHRGDVFGDPVNIAARIETITPADEIYFADAVYLTMNRSDISIDRVGQYELKGIREPVTVHRLKKFAHIENNENNEENAEGGDADSPIRAAGLPYGGAELDHWRRMIWVRRAYIAMWAMAVIGLVGAAYLRYRPTSDFNDTVAAMKEAVEAGNAQEALGLVGEIPLDAVHERRMARRYWRDAVHLLIDAGDVGTASSELERMLALDARDADALMLRGIARVKQGADLVNAMKDFATALAIKPALAENDDLVQSVVQGYADSEARVQADSLVAKHIKHRAVAALRTAMAEGLGDRIVQNTMASRLNRLGAGDKVDWVKLAIADLGSTSCKTRKGAIARLLGERDERGVGPLMKLAEAKKCGSQNARTAANTILKR